MFSTVLLIAGPVSIAGAGTPGRGDSADDGPVGLPFSTADIGWALSAAVLLLVLALVLQLATRRRRRRRVPSVARERTDP